MNLFDSSEILDSEGLELISLKKVNLDGFEPIFKKRHSHSVYEFYVQLKGSYVLNADSGSYSMGVGTAFLVPPGVYHMTQSASEDLCRVSISFKIEGERASEVKKKLHSGVYSFEIDEVLLNLCKKVFLEEREAPFFKEKVNSITTILLIELLRDIGVGELGNKKNKEETLEDFRTQTIDAFFDAHLLDDVTSDMLAEKLFISNRQLNRIMKKIYGLTFNQKLIAGRMDQAAWLLRTSDIPATKIAQAVGYESKSYFYRAFRAQYGLSPYEYRKKMRESEDDLQG